MSSKPFQAVCILCDNSIVRQIRVVTPLAPAIPLNQPALNDEGNSKRGPGRPQGGQSNSNNFNNPGHGQPNNHNYNNSNNFSNYNPNNDNTEQLLAKVYF